MSDESAAREAGTHRSRERAAVTTGRSATPAQSARLEHTAGRLGLRVVAWLAWTLSLAFTALALGLDHLTPYIPQRGPAAFPAAFAVLYAALSLAYPTVGALLALRRPGNPIGWIFCGAGFVIAFQALAMAYADYALYVDGSLPGLEYAAWLSDWIDFPVAALSTILLLLLFPSGRLPSRMLFPDGRVQEDRIWRGVVWAAVCGGVMDAFRYATWPGPLEGYPSVANPAGIDGAIGIFVATLFGGGANLLLLASLVFALVSLVNRLVLARGRERQQIKWVAFSAALMVFGFLGAITGGPYGLWDVLWFLGTLGYFLFPIAVGIAVLRYRLWDIDLIVNRALVYGTLTGIVVGAYALVVGGLGALAQARGDLAVALLAAGVVVVLVQPLRARLQRSVDRLITTTRPAVQESPDSQVPGRMAFFGIGARGAARLAWSL